MCFEVFGFKGWEGEELELKNEDIDKPLMASNF